jgi:hypothetical protein
MDKYYSYIPPDQSITPPYIDGSTKPKLGWTKGADEAQLRAAADAARTAAESQFYSTDCSKNGCPAVYTPNLISQVIPKHTSSIASTYRTGQGITYPQEQLDFKGFTMDQVPFLFLQDHRKDYKSSVDEAIKGTQAPSELSDIFFSKENIDNVRKDITKAVFEATKRKVMIDDQPFMDVLIRMQTVYYQYGRFLPTDIQRQVDELNYITIKETVPEVIVQIKQKLGYIRDISRPPDMMNQPLNVSKAGRKSNRSISSIYNF